MGNTTKNETIIFLATVPRPDTSDYFMMPVSIKYHIFDDIANRLQLSTPSIRVKSANRHDFYHKAFLLSETQFCELGNLYKSTGYRLVSLGKGSSDEMSVKANSALENFISEYSENK